MIIDSRVIIHKIDSTTQEATYETNLAEPEWALYKDIGRVSGLVIYALQRHLAMIYKDT